MRLEKHHVPIQQSVSESQHQDVRAPLSHFSQFPDKHIDRKQQARAQSEGNAVFIGTKQTSIKQ